MKPTIFVQPLWEERKKPIATSNNVKIMIGEFTENLTYYQGNRVEKERERHTHTGIQRDAGEREKEREKEREIVY